MSNIEKAIEIAARAHAGITDKAGAPYIFHLKLHVSCAKNSMPGNIFRDFLNQKD